MSTLKYAGDSMGKVRIEGLLQSRLESVSTCRRYMEHPRNCWK
jgi:hypothetical protein